MKLLDAIPGETDLALDELPEMADEAETLEVIDAVHDECVAALMVQHPDCYISPRWRGSGYPTRPRSGPVSSADEAGRRVLIGALG
jgi:hypothetical protein